MRRAVEVRLPDGAASAAAWAEIQTVAPAIEDGRDLRVVGRDGSVLPIKVLRAGKGALASFVFEARPGPLHVYFGNANAKPAPDWDPPAGVILETFARPDGPADNWNQVRRLFDSGPKSFGRILRKNVFDGANPLGPSTDFLSRYKAVLRIPAKGRYRFATVSDDASFLFVDGAKVCEWPGWHGAGEGNRGKFHGDVELGPGPHRLEYFHVQGEGESVAEAAWIPPGQDRPQVIPPEAFEPVLPAKVGVLEGENGPLPDEMGWRIEAHVSAGPFAAVEVSFKARDRGRLARWRWDFGDGSTDEGAEVSHLFLGEGLRTVRLAGRGGRGEIPETVRSVEVHRDWAQIREAPEGRGEAYRKALARRDLAREDGRALETLFRIAVSYHQESAAASAAAEALRRPADVPEARRLPFFFDAGMLLQDMPGQETRVEEAFARAREAATGGGERARADLHLAGFLIHARSNGAESEKLLASIPPGDLDAADRRLRTIFRGDAAAMRKDRTGAEARYREAGVETPGEDAAARLRRSARLQAAQDYLRRGETEAAREAVRQVEWEDPMERLGLDTGLLLAEIHVARGDLLRAEAAARRILAANPDAARTPEALFLLARILDRAKRTPEADAVRADLLRRFPYSEEAAKSGARR